MDWSSVVDKLKALWAMQDTKPAPVVPPPRESPALDSGVRGIRNNNPGNLRPGSEPWVGQVRVADGFCVFDTAEHGIRALAKLLVIYQDRYGCATVSSIITRWAPPSENNTTAYINAVCADTGFGRDDWLHMGEPSVLDAMVRAIIHHECGSCPYTDSVIAAAVKDALA